MSDDKITDPAERQEAMAVLARVTAAAQECRDRLAVLAAHSDRVGIGALPWDMAVEMAARAEMHQRLHDDLEYRRLQLGLPLLEGDRLN